MPIPEAAKKSRPETIPETRPSMSGTTNPPANKRVYFSIAALAVLSLMIALVSMKSSAVSRKMLCIFPPKINEFVIKSIALESEADLFRAFIFSNACSSGIPASTSLSAAENSSLSGLGECVAMKPSVLSCLVPSGIEEASSNMSGTASSMDFFLCSNKCRQ